MIANLSAEDQVRALCQLCGFAVCIDKMDHMPIRIQIGSGVGEMIGTDDCADSKIAWDHFCYRTWESALKGIATFTPSSS